MDVPFGVRLPDRQRTYRAMHLPFGDSLPGRPGDLPGRERAARIAFQMRAAGKGGAPQAPEKECGRRCGGPGERRHYETGVL